MAMRPAQIARAHADWLGLVETPSAFLSVPVLRRVFPHGIDQAPDDVRATVRATLSELDSDQGTRTDWVRWLLREGLGLGPVLREGQAVPETATYFVPEHGELLRPEFVVTEPNGDRRLRLLVMTWPYGTRRDAPVPDRRWAATPLERAAALARATEVPLVMATDGDWFSIVSAPAGQATTSATWLSSIFVEERGLLDSFWALLSLRRFFGVDSHDTLEAMLAESSLAQEEVTTTLGHQVRQAVELLVHALSRANREHGGQLLENHPLDEVYAAALTMMMRLVFLLYAEERDLLPGRDPVYAESYGVLGLRAALRDEADRFGDESLERRRAAWYRILATGRAIHGGIEHDQLRLPAYGGSLFDPDRYPFLEGRRADEPWREHVGRPLPVDDRSVLAILTALQVLAFRDAGVVESRPLSYRALDVEQIGYVYEGLLDHGARPVDDLGVALKGAGPDGPELAVSLIEDAAGGGRGRLVSFLSETTRLSSARVERELNAVLAPEDERALREVCEHDEPTVERVRPYHALLERDLRGLPLVFLPGSIYVTKTSERRDTGTQYTPKDLADEIVEFALQPLVYEPGPGSGRSRDEWRLRRPDQILDLRVCDPAVGSGAILVAACRYLTDRLIESVAQNGWADPPPGAPEMTGDESEIALAARRLVVDRCLFGVDRNPLAAEMAKLSLWLVTMSRERPFTFLDHAVRVGDSLLGITTVEQIRWLHLDPARGQHLHRNLLGVPEAIRPLMDQAISSIQAMRAIPTITVRDADDKRRLSDAADDALGPIRVLADALIGKALRAAQRNGPSLDDSLIELSIDVRRSVDPARQANERAAYLSNIETEAAYDLDTDRPPLAMARRPLHWPLAFPEVFLDAIDPGFDAIVGNPPFQGGQRLSGALGSAVREYYVNQIAQGARGSADLCAYFFLRASGLVRSTGTLGLFATNTIAQGDTREVGLDRLLADGWKIHRATKSRQWPGAANVQISQIGMSRSDVAAAVLDGVGVPLITSSLEAADQPSTKPHRLVATAGRSFQGSNILGGGFTMGGMEARTLIDRDRKNAEVLFPVMNGDDLTTSPTQETDRWVINFQDWPIDRARGYPDCFEIVERLVKPERARINVKRSREVWWQFTRPTVDLYRAVAGMRRAIAIARVSKVVLPVWVATGTVWTDAVVLFAYDDDFHFGVLTSSLHWSWVIQNASTLESRIRYTPTDVFETFPQPPATDRVAAAAAALDAHRRDLMIAASEGLTRTHNRVNDREDVSAAINRLRQLHVDLDQAVAEAYGWSDIGFAHSHYETQIGLRYTISPGARREVLTRLLELNHDRYDRETAEGLHQPGAGAGRSRRRGSDVTQLTLGKEA
jgi:hypothetical protein